MTRFQPLGVSWVVCSNWMMRTLGFADNHSLTSTSRVDASWKEMNIFIFLLTWSVLRICFVGWQQPGLARERLSLVYFNDKDAEGYSSKEQTNEKKVRRVHLVLPAACPFDLFLIVVPFFRFDVIFLWNFYPLIGTFGDVTYILRLSPLPKKKIPISQYFDCKQQV